MERRWYYVGLVAVAIAISYFDRQTLPVAITAIQKNIPLSDQQFSYLGTAFLLSYAALYVVGGRLLDVLGTRRGFLLIMIGWSLASALHAVATGFSVLLLARLALGAGEGGAFPAATRVVAEWIPTHARSTAMGLINAGTAVGSLLAPPLIGVVLLHSGWRAMFLLSGALGLAWVLWWALSYRPNSNTLSVNTVDARLAASEMTWGKVVKMRNVQSFVFAKFMSDSAWYFLLFWLPKYLYDARGFDIKHVSYYAWIPYAASGVGSFVGGWFSSELLAPWLLAGPVAQTGAGPLCGGHAGCHAGLCLSGAYSDCALQHRLLLPAGVVGPHHDTAHRCLPTHDRGDRRRVDRFRRRYRRSHLQPDRRPHAANRVYVLYDFYLCWIVSSHRLSCHSSVRRQDPTPSLYRPKNRRVCMKITEIRTRVVQWEGKTVPLPPHFCTNPMDLVAFREASMGNFAFHNWLLVEIFTDSGLVGLGNAALSPMVTKSLIDIYLKPLLLGADPWDVEYLWQQMYRRTLAFGRKGVALVAISAVDIALWDLLGKAAKQPVFRLLGGRTKERIPVYASRLYAMPIPELRAEAQKYKRRRLHDDEAALRLGAAGWRRGHAEESGAGARCARGRG